MISACGLLSLNCSIKASLTGSVNIFSIAGITVAPDQIFKSGKRIKFPIFIFALITLAGLIMSRSGRVSYYRWWGTLSNQLIAVFR